MNVFSVFSVQRVSAAVWQWHCVCLLWCGRTCKLFSTAELNKHANMNTQWDIFHVNIRVSSLTWTTIHLLLWRREGGVRHLETGNEVRPAACTGPAVSLFRWKIIWWWLYSMCSLDKQCWSRQLFSEPRPFCSNLLTIRANLQPVTDWRLVGISYRAEGTDGQMIAGDN